jgi:6-phosphogluconolactonase/glucosamine-6-phosphate isomerase/deaminase
MTHLICDTTTARVRAIPNSQGAAELAGCQIDRALGQGIPVRGMAGMAVCGVRSSIATFAELTRLGIDWARVCVTCLFPRSPALANQLDVGSASSCVAVPAGTSGEAPHQLRMSLALGAIAKAGSIILLSSGASKLASLKQVLSTLFDPDRLPVATLFAVRPDTIILHSAA